MKWLSRKKPEGLDVAVIGAGLNGLACAAMLARVGRRVLVVEARDETGGLARSGEVLEGFRGPLYAHLLRGVPAELMRALRLERHGLKLSMPDVPTLALDPEGRALRFQLKPRERAPMDDPAGPLRRFALRAEQLARPLRPLLDDWRPGRWNLSRGPLPPELARLAMLSLEEWLDEQTDDAGAKAVIAAEAALATGRAPRAAGSALAHVLAIAAREAGGALLYPLGGPGAFAEALLRSARERGAELRLGARAERILLADGRVSALRLASGEEIAVSAIVSSLDSTATLLGLAGEEHLDLEAAVRLARPPAPGLTAKINVALNAPPALKDQPPELLPARFVLAPSLAGLDEAYRLARSGKFGRPAIELLFPSVHDPMHTPLGSHVASIIVHPVPHEAEGGWSAVRDVFFQSIVARLEPLVGDLTPAILSAATLTPADLAREGHAAVPVSLTRALSASPLTPVPGIYCCGDSSRAADAANGYGGLVAARAVLAGGAAR